MNSYDPVKLSEEIRKKVVDGEKRKYYRFRKARFYGGIATGDCVGCNLSCHFCWSKKPLNQPEKVGKFYTPTEVKEKLVEIADKNNFHLIRLSGNEPTIGRKHLISFLEEIENKDLKFILETNGILIGNDSSFAEDLKDFDDIQVRVSFKGCTKEKFTKLTGADPSGFELQIQALRSLNENNVDCHPAIMTEFAEKKEIISFMKTLRRIDSSFAQKVEHESLNLYPHVKKRLKKAGIEIPEK